MRTNDEQISRTKPEQTTQNGWNISITTFTLVKVSYTYNAPNRGFNRRQKS